MLQVRGKHNFELSQIWNANQCPKFWDRLMATTVEQKGVEYRYQSDQQDARYNDAQLCFQLLLTGTSYLCILFLNEKLYQR